YRLFVRCAGRRDTGKARFGEALRGAVREDAGQAALVPRLRLKTQVAVAELASRREAPVHGTIAAGSGFAHVGHQDLARDVLDGRERDAGIRREPDIVAIPGPLHVPRRAPEDVDILHVRLDVIFPVACAIVWSGVLRPDARQAL